MPNTGNSELVALFEWGYFLAEKFHLLWVIQAVIVVRLVMVFSRYLLSKL